LAPPRRHKIDRHVWYYVWKFTHGANMATNLSIDPELIERALELSGERTKKTAVTKALREFIARRRQKRLLDLMGKLEWDSSYDYKAERGRD
jgi:Arc/MetJ family transcription regulator